MQNLQSSQRSLRWILLAGLLAAACGREDSSSGRTQALEAPADWQTLLEWADEQLRSPVPDAVLPAPPLLAPPPHGLHRLEELFGQARVEGDRRPRPPSEALLALGPFRSDAPRPRRGFVVRRLTEGSAAGSLELTLGGFQVPRARIGMIEIDLQLPFGRQFLLKWGQVEEIAVPVARHDGFFKVRLRTDGLPDWKGPLEQLRLRTDGAGDGTVVIRSLRLLPPADAWPEEAGVGRASLAGALRTVVYAHGNATIRLPHLDLAAGSRFSAVLGRTGSREEDTPLRFELSVDGEAAGVWKPAAGSGWTPVQADLARWQGRRAELVLSVTGADAAEVAFWGEPTVFVPEESPPLVIVYLVDTLAAGHASLYGYREATMPRLEALAARGAWFPAMAANSSRTIESIPDLMLSLSTDRTGIYHTSTPASGAFVTLAECFRAAGFATASFCTNPYAGPQQAMDQGFDLYVDPVGSHETRLPRVVPIEPVEAWLEEHRGRPRFLYIHTMEPHSPYYPPLRFRGRFDTGYRGSIDGSRHPEHGFRTAGTAREIAHVVSLYDAEVSWADSRLGDFLDFLEAAGLVRDAWIFVLSDHGEEFHEHGDWEHGTSLHATQTRIPLVVAGPGVVPGPRDGPAQILDVMPTLLDLFGLPRPYELEGRSLAEDLLQGRPAAPRPVFSSNHAWRLASTGVAEYGLLLDGRWQLLAAARPPSGGGGSRFALYDLQADPAETRNLLLEERPRARRMILQLVGWHESLARFGTGDGPALEVDYEGVRLLKELGYLQGGRDGD